MEKITAKIKDIKPNPFRQIEKYQLSEEKILRLKQSINQTGYWGNILTRIDNEIIQLAYGHHRHETLKRIFGEEHEIDIIVQNLSDADMVRIMANENARDWSDTPMMVNATVDCAKKFLDTELAKYETWDHVNKSIKMMFDSNSQFQNCKKNGVGQTTIMKFLGGAPLWPQTKIQEALHYLDEKDISRTASEVFIKRTDARNFRRAIKKIKTDKHNPIDIKPKETEDIAKKVFERTQKMRDHKQDTGAEHSTTTETMIRQIINDEPEGDEFASKMSDLSIAITRIVDESKSLAKRINKLNGEFEELQINQVNGFESIIAADSFIELYRAINTLSNFLGFSFKTN